MAGWFLFSAVLSAYNKLVFGSGHLAFPCPLLLTSIHFGCQWIFSATLCAIWPIELGGDRIARLSWREWLSTSVPCGLVTSGDIGLSNKSLVTITLTFYTMVKASTPIFVLLWAYVFGIERITPSLILVVAIIAAGEFLTVVGEVDFDLRGFILCLTASILSGARWTLVQLKLQSMEPPLKTTIATMRLLAPSMFTSMLFLSMAIERPWNKFGDMDFASAVQITGLGLFGAFFAIAMILCEFYLIMYASAIILMIGGVIKEMITIVVGVAYFEDELNRINLAGCFIVFMGVVVYKITFHLDQQHRKTEPNYQSVSRQSTMDSGEDFSDGLYDDAGVLAEAAVEHQGVELRRPSGKDILGDKDML